MKIRFWGTRGSIPVPGKNTLKYGGNTSCIQVTLKTGKTLILDAGSGIRELGNDFTTFSNEKDINIFVTHTHWDHIQGLPFFKPLFNKNYNIEISLFKMKGKEISQVIKGQMNNYFFPVTSELLPAKIKYHEINEGDEIFFDDAVIIPKRVRHSNGTFAFKIIEDDKSIVYMTDNEIKYTDKKTGIDTKSILKNNKDQIKFCSGVDYLIHDTMYFFDDYVKNWGHSNDLSAAVFGHLAEVKNLLLFHYNPEYDDDAIDKLLAATRKNLKELNSEVKCYASYEGLVLEI